MEFISKIIYKAKPSQAVLNINLPQPSTSTDEGLAFIDKIMRPRPTLHFPPKDGEPQTFKPSTDGYGNASSPFFDSPTEVESDFKHAADTHCQYTAIKMPKPTQN
jgi:hypothetical protein